MTNLTFSADQVRTIARLIEENDAALDPARWVDVEVGGLGSGRRERKIVGTVVSVALRNYDPCAIVLHRIYSDSTTHYIRRDGTIAASAS